MFDVQLTVPVTQNMTVPLKEFIDGLFNNCSEKEREQFMKYFMYKVCCGGVEKPCDWELRNYIESFARVVGETRSTEQCNVITNAITYHSVKNHHR